jgi:hypothetical protein
MPENIYYRVETWENFQSAGMLWFINRILHVFGWAIVLEITKSGGVVQKIYPARTKFRGFTVESEAEGFKQVARFMRDSAPNLLKEALNLTNITATGKESMDEENG